MNLFRVRDGSIHALKDRMHGIDKLIVYIVRSDVDPSRHYVGITNDIRSRPRDRVITPGIDLTPSLLVIVLGEVSFCLV